MSSWFCCLLVAIMVLWSFGRHHVLFFLAALLVLFSSGRPIVVVFSWTPSWFGFLLVAILVFVTLAAVIVSSL